MRFVSRFFFCLFLFCFHKGELLHVDCLLSQTGKPIKPDSKSEEKDILKDVDAGEEEENEGFEEDMKVDHTVSSLFDGLCVSLSSSQPLGSSPDYSFIHPTCCQHTAARCLCST